MLQTTLAETKEPSLLSLLAELEQVTDKSVGAHKGMTLFNYLSICQWDVVRIKKAKIEGMNFYKGSAIKTMIDKMPKDDSVYWLTEDLCDHFRIHHGLVIRMQLYVFFNAIFNPKSKIRKPPPLVL